MGCGPKFAGEFSWSTFARTPVTTRRSTTRADMRCWGRPPNRIGISPALSAPSISHTGSSPTKAASLAATASIFQRRRNGLGCGFSPTGHPCRTRSRRLPGAARDGPARPARIRPELPQGVFDTIAVFHAPAFQAHEQRQGILCSIRAVAKMGCRKRLGQALGQLGLSITEIGGVLPEQHPQSLPPRGPQRRGRALPGSSSRAWYTSSVPGFAAQGCVPQRPQAGRPVSGRRWACKSCGW